MLATDQRHSLAPLTRTTTICLIVSGKVISSNSYLFCSSHNVQKGNVTLNSLKFTFALFIFNFIRQYSDTHETYQLITERSPTDVNQEISELQTLNSSVEQK
jgi:hypothetical protein